MTGTVQVFKSGLADPATPLTRANALCNLRKHPFRPGTGAIVADCSRIAHLVQQVSDLVALLPIIQDRALLRQQQTINVGTARRSELLQIVSDLLNVKRVILATGADVLRAGPGSVCDRCGNSQVWLTAFNELRLSQAGGGLSTDGQVFLYAVKREHIFQRQVFTGHKEFGIRLVNDGTEDRQLGLIRCPQVVVGQWEEAIALLVDDPMDTIAMWSIRFSSVMAATRNGLR